MRAFVAAVALALLVSCVPKPSFCQDDTQTYGACMTGIKIPDTQQERWSYSLQNTSQDDRYTVFLLQLEVDEVTQIVSIESPDLWSPDTTIPHFITWFCEGELPASAIQDGFEVQYSATPTYQSWSVMFDFKDDPDLSASTGGDVLVSYVPEPASISSLVVGLAAIAGAYIKRRR